MHESFSSYLESRMQPPEAEDDRGGRRRRRVRENEALKRNIFYELYQKFNDVIAHAAEEA